MAKISKFDATAAQLRTFLEKHCGVPHIHPSTNKSTLLAKLATLYPEDEIEVEGDSGSTEAPKTESAPDNVVDIPQEFDVQQPNTPVAKDATHALGGMTSRDAPKVTVMIFNQEGAAGTQKVFLGWNTKGMLVERAKPQPIPYPYYETLKNAVETQTFQDDKGEDVQNEVQAFPFQVLKMPPQAEIDAWRKRCAESDPTQVGNKNYIGAPKRHRNAQ